MCLFKGNYVFNQTEESYAAALLRRLINVFGYLLFKVYLDYAQGEEPSRKMDIKIDYLGKQSLCLDHCFLPVTLAALAFFYK